MLDNSYNLDKFLSGKRIDFDDAAGMRALEEELEKSGSSELKKRIFDKIVAQLKEQSGVSNIFDHLFSVAQKGEGALMRLFIKCYPHIGKEALLRRDDEGNTLLHLAVEEGDMETVRALLSGAPDKEVKEFLFQKNRALMTPLHIAVRDDNTDMVKVLLQECPEKSRKIIFDANVRGLFPLGVAMTHENRDIINLLLASCSDIASKKRLFQIGAGGQTALNCVANVNLYDMARLLLKICPEEIRSGLFKSDNRKRTPMHEAIFNQNFEMMSLLRDYFDSEIRDTMFIPDNSGVTMADYALTSNNAQVGEWFLANYCKEAKNLYKVFNPDRESRSILRIAIERSPDKNIIRLLDKCPQEYRNRVFRKECLELAVKNGKIQTAVHLCAYNPELKKVLYSFFDNWVTASSVPLKNLIPVYSVIDRGSGSLRKLLDKFERADEEDREIIDFVFQRAVGRNPGFAKGIVEMPEISGFIDALMALHREMKRNNKKYFVPDILRCDFKMNQNLLMNAETVGTISSIFSSLPGNKNLEFRFRLALQTHENLEEIKALFADPNFIEEELAEKDKFFELPAKKQISFMLRSQIFRDYQAIPQANRILKKVAAGQNVDEEIVRQTLKLLAKTEAEGSENNRERLLKIASDENFTSDTRGLAIQAFSGIEFSPRNRENREALRLLLNSTQEPPIQCAILDALGAYEFSAEDEEAIDQLVAFSRGAKDEVVKRSCAFLLSVITREDALKEALTIVNSPVWDSIDFGREDQDRVRMMGWLYMFTYRPAFHDNRSSMRKIIAERLLLLHRKDFGNSVRKILSNYRVNKAAYPSLKKIEDKIVSMPNDVRYEPFQLFFPENKCLFRGFKAGSLGQFDSFLMKGSGSYNLRLFDLDNNPLWARIGQVFMSATSDYVMGSYFQSDGVLITIDSNYVNEAFLRRNIRLQKDGAIHPVSYKKIVHDFISGIFVARSGPPAEKVASLTEHKVSSKIPRTTKLNALEKIQKRRLLGTDRRGKSLKDRVFYFDPKDDLKRQVKNIMKEQGLSEMSMEEIVEENLQRRVVREILANTLEDPELRGCMRSALE